MTAALTLIKTLSLGLAGFCGMFALLALCQASFDMAVLIGAVSGFIAAVRVE